MRYENPDKTTIDVPDSAIIEDGAVIGPGSVIGPGAFIRAGAFIGARAFIRDESVIRDEAVIGKGAVIRDEAVIREEDVIGETADVKAKADILTICSKYNGNIIPMKDGKIFIRIGCEVRLPDDWLANGETLAIGHGEESWWAEIGKRMLYFLLCEAMKYQKGE